MSFLNAVLRSCFEVLLYPFRELPPLAGLVVVSLATSIGMLVVFKATSDQKKLAEVKRHIHACLFEIRLFSDDLRAILRAQGEMLRHNVTYLRLSLVPMLWMILPLGLVIAQLQFHYAYTGLSPGQTTVVKVALRAAPDGDPARAPATVVRKPEIVLQAPPGLLVETPAVWIPSRRELAWRIAVEKPGDYQLEVRTEQGAETKEVRVTGAVVRRSPVRTDSRFLMQLLYPAEDSLSAASPIRSIGLIYPERDIEILGCGVHWMVLYFVLSILFAFMLRNLFKVTI